MKVGGVQKSLQNLLWAISDKYDITLYLFEKTGDLLEDIPSNVTVKTGNSLFRYLGISQAECKTMKDRICRGLLVLGCKMRGRSFIMPQILKSQKNIAETYDVAIAYLQNGEIKHFYGGVNEFVLDKVNAKQKISFLHCDYQKSGANAKDNNNLYKKFDAVAACSKGCLESFLNVMPELKNKSHVVRNFHRINQIKAMADSNPIQYDKENFHAVVVGRLAHEKAVERAILAVSEAVRRGFNVKLHIIGEGNMRQSLEKMVLELNLEERVYFYGEQENPYRYMKNADLLVVPSYFEAAPMVIDEAYILELPVLSVETTSSQEMVIDRNCGWVCENSQAALNEKLVDILSKNLCHRIKEIWKQQKVDANLEAYRQFQELVGSMSENAE